MALYEATDGPNWIESENWGTDAPLEEWYGVAIGRNGFVSGVFLGGNNLVGQLPPELALLREPFVLDFTDNRLTGPIPAEFGNNDLLNSLRLSLNQLEGPLSPELWDDGQP